MPPILEVFPASELPERVQFQVNGKKRKQPIDLKKCKLYEMEQFRCDVQDRNDPKSVVVCEPLLRLFRKCANGVIVETTAWD